MMKRLLLILLMCMPCWSANDFSADPNVVALWTFEEGSGTTPYVDHSANSNTLNGNIVRNTTSYHEGTTSNHNTSLSYSLYRTDATLSADFPGKDGTTNRTFSFAAWVRPTTLYDYNYVMAKWSTSNGRQYNIIVYDVTGTQRFRAVTGYNSGANAEGVDHLTVAVGTNKWYHVTMTYDSSTKGVKIRVYDEDATTASESTATLSNEMTIAATTFTLCNVNYIATYGMVGQIDEAVMFNDVLTSDEIDQIRSGTYGGGGQVMPVLFED